MNTGTWMERCTMARPASQSNTRREIEMARSQLIQILKDHGVRAYAAHGRIFARNVYADEAGVLHDDWIRLRPSLKAVRDFLGD